MIESILSPDGLLELVVEDKEGDVAIGFKGLPWHTHADILSELYGVDKKVAVDRFLEEVTSGRVAICVLREGGAIVDAWVTDDPAREKPIEGEDLEIRDWKGQPPG